MIKKNMKGKVEETLVHNDDNSREIKKEKNISSSSFQIKIQGFKYKSCFSIFPFQQEAFDFFDSFDLQNNDSDGKNDENQNDPSTDDTKSNQESLCFSLERRLFALEYNAKGKRKYVVSHLGRFIQHYWKETNPSNRNHYELIREDTPCRLFFDLEYNKKANPNITENDNVHLLNEFIQELTAEMQSVFNISITRKHIVDLDSSTDKKFSRHLIVHMPNGALFADAPSCGVFVKNFVGRLAEEVATGEMKDKHGTLAKYLFVNNNEEASRQVGEKLMEKGEQNMKSKVCFIDTGVYTRNRIFRILGSVKYGKPPTAALRIASTNEFPFPMGFGNELFYNSDNDSKNPIDDEDSYWQMHASALIDTFVVPMSKQRINAIILPEQKANHLPLSDENNANLMKTGKSIHSNFGPSPYPLLDKYIGNTLANRKGLNGSIRSWKCDNDRIKYFMKDNRWCENINRSHKSNNIIWNVSLFDCTYWQSCLDPDCRFSGVVKKLPSDVKESLTECSLEKRFDVSDDVERAMMQINLNEIDPSKQPDFTSPSKTYDVDESFNLALMNLSLSALKTKKTCQDDKDNNENISR